MAAVAIARWAAVPAGHEAQGALRRHADGAGAVLEVKAVTRRAGRRAPVRPVVDAFAVARTDRVGRLPAFPRGQREPRRAGQASACAQAPARPRAEKLHQRRGIDRAAHKGPRHPGPARADLRPAAVVKRREAPGRGVDPGPAPRRHPGPAAIAIGGPVHRGDRGVPDGAVGGVLRPLAVGVERLVAGHVWGQVAGRHGLLLQAIAHGHPLAEGVARRRGAAAQHAQIARGKHDLLAGVHAHGLAGRAVHGGGAGAQGDARGVTGSVGVHAELARLRGHQGQLRGVQLDALAGGHVAQAQRRAALREGPLGVAVVQRRGVQSGRALQAQAQPTAVQLDAGARVQLQPGARGDGPVERRGRPSTAIVHAHRALERADVGHARRRIGLGPGQGAGAEQQGQREAAPQQRGQLHGRLEAGGKLSSAPDDSTLQARLWFAGPSARASKVGRWCATRCKWISAPAGQPAGRAAPRAPQRANAALTAALTWPMSALPAKRVLTAAITLPMSPGPAAPSSATMAATAAWTSSADRRAGR